MTVKKKGMDNNCPRMDGGRKAVGQTGKSEVEEPAVMTIRM